MADETDQFFAPNDDIAEELRAQGFIDYRCLPPRLSPSWLSPSPHAEVTTTARRSR